MLLLLCYPFRYEPLNMFLIPQGAVQMLYNYFGPLLPPSLSQTIYSETFAHKKNN